MIVLNKLELGITRDCAVICITVNKFYNNILIFSSVNVSGLQSRVMHFESRLHVVPLA
jgi:hypothetical protein